MTSQSKVLASLTADHAALYSATIEALRISTAEEKLASRKQSVTSIGVKIAIETGMSDKFEEIVGDYFKLLTANVNGMAVAAKCTINQRQSKDATDKMPAVVVYNIPASLSNMKSTLIAALDFDVDLIGEDGEPASFNSIKKAVAVCRAEDKQAGLGEVGKLKQELLKRIAEITATCAESDSLDLLTEYADCLLDCQLAMAAASNIESESDAEVAILDAA